MEGDDHAAEVLAHEVGEELGTGVALVDVVFGEDFVGEVGAGFEGELFGEDERVVAVEEELGYLVRMGVSEGVWRGWEGVEGEVAWRSREL